jgi:hypothetical protein
MVRGSILQTAGLFIEDAAPDHDMWVRIKELSDFHYIGEKLFSYRVHGEQQSQTIAEAMWKSELGTLERAMSRYPYPRYFKRKRLAVIHYRLGELHLQRKLYASAAYHFLCAFSRDPKRALSISKRL